MTNSINTKRTFWGAVLSLILCVSMLVGTTFAWFTDTASTAVNSVQSGTLDIELQYQKDDGSWANAEGTTLSFKKNAAAPAGEKILWEPGCTYELPAVKVVNKGNLAVKYQIAISGIDGDAKLNEVIDWTYNNQAVLTSEGTLLADKESEPITIKGHMQETANNDYQNLTIDGIAITVYATQLAYEYDSFGNQYDNIALVSDADALANAIAEGKNVMLTNDVALDVNGKAMTVAADADVIIDLNGNDIVGTTTASGASQILFEVKGKLTVMGVGTIALYDNSGAAFNQGYENAAIYVNGGVANLNEGMIVCTSVGEAMAYAADAVGGNSVINVNGATLYSSYIGVRSFPTASGKTNTVNYNSGVVYGAKNGYDIWTQEGSGSSVVNIADGINYTREEQWGGMYYIADVAAYVSTATALQNAIAANKTILLIGTIDLGGQSGAALNIANDVTIKGGAIKGTGWTGELNYAVNATSGNIVFDGVTFDTTDWTTVGWAKWGISANVNGTANVTFKNCTFKGTQCPIYQSGAESVITLENCKFDTASVAIQCEIYSGDFQLGQDLIIKSCDFNGVADVMHIYDYDKNPSSEAMVEYLTANGNTFTGVCKQTCN